MHSSFLLSFLSAGALTFALPYSSTEPTTTILDAFTNYPAPAAPTGGLHLPKSNLTSAANTTSSTPSSKLGSHHGWVGSYDNGYCTGNYHKDRPEMNTGDCIKFHPDSDFVGVNWGTWPLTFDSFDAFTDDNCQKSATSVIKKPDYESKTGPGMCYSVSALGAPWGSIRKHYDAVE